MRISKLTLMIALGFSLTTTVDAQNTTQLSDLKKPITTKSSTTSSHKTSHHKSHKTNKKHAKKSRYKKHYKHQYSKHKRHSVKSNVNRQRIQIDLESFEKAVANQQWQQAEIYKQRILKAAAKDPNLYNALGYVLIDQSNHYEEGLMLVEKTLAKIPNEHNSLESKAWAYTKLKRYEEALAIFPRILDKFTPGEYNYAETYSHYAYALFQAGDKENAEKNWKIAQADQPEHPVVLAIGEVLGFIRTEQPSDTPTPEKTVNEVAPPAIKKEAAKETETPQPTENVPTPQKTTDKP
jgi:tetratricopeptide (TPR) repeat protein